MKAMGCEVSDDPVRVNGLLSMLFVNLATFLLFQTDEEKIFALYVPHYHCCTSVILDFVARS